MSDFYTILTTLGSARLTEAMGLGRQIDLTHMALGDGGGNTTVPDESMTELVNEVYRAGINSLTVDPTNPNWLVAEMIVPTDVGGWTVREVGLLTTKGELFAVGNFPATYKPVLAEGSARELQLKIYLEISKTSAINLVVDPSVVFASRTYVEQLQGLHESSRNHPTATLLDNGFVRLASQEEVNAGEHEHAVVTPSTLAERLRAIPNADTTTHGLARVATQNEVNAGEESEAAVTPATLAERLSALPEADENTYGLTRLASTEETIAGEENGKAVTPTGLANVRRTLRLKSYFFMG